MKDHRNHEAGEWRYDCDGCNPITGHAGYPSRTKRLTGQELAAEVWHSITHYFTLCPSPEAVEEARRNRVIERFATHPNYDQEDQ